jgi:hypothetical protein
MALMRHLLRLFALGLSLTLPNSAVGGHPVSVQPAAPHAGSSEAAEVQLRRAIQELDEQILMGHSALRSIVDDPQQRRALARDLLQMQTARNDLARLLRKLERSREAIDEAAAEPDRATG